MKRTHAELQRAAVAKRKEKALLVPASRVAKKAVKAKAKAFKGNTVYTKEGIVRTLMRLRNYAETARANGDLAAAMRYKRAFDKFTREVDAALTAQGVGPITEAEKTP